MTTRRELLLGLGAAALAPACGRGRSPAGDTGSDAPPAPDRAPEPPAWDPGGTHDATAFPWGVVAGDPVADGVLLTLRTAETGCVLVVVAADGDGWVEVHRGAPTDPRGRAVATELTGLSADTAHRYAWFAADGARRSEVGRFRTMADAATPVRKWVFGATSCWGSINPDCPSLLQGAADQADAFFHLGDAVYADGSVTLDDYRAEWDRMFVRPAMQAAFASTAVVATWDDHEVDDDWVPDVTVTDPQVADALQAFREAIPMRQGPGGSGLWRTLSFGPAVDVFVLDSRGERAPPDRIVSDEQLDAMIAALDASTARFKLVLVSVHLADHDLVMGPVQAQDRWQGYPAQRDALVAACERVPGVIVITGDMHYSGVQTLGPPGDPGDAVVELAVGPAGSRLNPLDEIVALAAEPMPQYIWLGTTWTWTRLTLDPSTGSALAEFLDDLGAVVGSHRWTP